MRIIGCFEKAGKIIGQVRYGDDVVLATIRQASYSETVQESIDFLESEAGLTKALTTLRSMGVPFRKGVDYVDRVLETLQEEKTSQGTNGGCYSEATFKLKGSDKLITLHEYNGPDDTKQGRIYVKGIIEFQQVLIPAEHPKEEPKEDQEFNFLKAVRQLLPIAKYGQLMLKGADQLGLLRVVKD
jgi:hypothetical protein